MHVPLLYEMGRRALATHVSWNWQLCNRMCRCRSLGMGVFNRCTQLSSSRHEHFCGTAVGGRARFFLTPTFQIHLRSGLVHCCGPPLLLWAGWLRWLHVSQCKTSTKAHHTNCTAPPGPAQESLGLDVLYLKECLAIPAGSFYEGMFNGASAK